MTRKQRACPLPGSQKYIAPLTACTAKGACFVSRGPATEKHGRCAVIFSFQMIDAQVFAALPGYAKKSACR